MVVGATPERVLLRSILEMLVPPMGSAPPVTVLTVIAVRVAAVGAVSHATEARPQVTMGSAVTSMPALIRIMIALPKASMAVAKMAHAMVRVVADSMRTGQSARAPAARGTTGSCLTTAVAQALVMTQAKKIVASIHAAREIA